MSVQLIAYLAIIIPRTIGKNQEKRKNISQKTIYLLAVITIKMNPNLYFLNTCWLKKLVGE